MVEKSSFGILENGEEASLFTVTNKNGMCMTLTDIGATIVSLVVPDKNGEKRDVVLGHDNGNDYLTCGGYIGACIGRFANRIAKGKFTIDGVEYQATVNDGVNSLHGGAGVSFCLWDAKEDGDGVIFTHSCADMEDGFPGKLDMTVRISLDEENGLHLAYSAVSDKETICNLTNHTYFNFNKDAAEIGNHELFINADEYSMADEGLIPTGNAKTTGTAFDFLTMREIGEPVYDSNFILNGGDGPAAALYEKTSGIYMEVFTDCPDCQLYTAGSLPEQTGKGGVRYGRGKGVCLETQQMPDCPNNHGSDGYRVVPGEVWHTETVYRFSVKAK